MILKTATGKEFNTGYFVKSEDPDALYFDIDGEHPKTVNDVFCDPEETSRIEWNGEVFEGYTKFGNIEIRYESVRVRLGKHG